MRKRERDVCELLFRDCTLMEKGEELVEENGREMKQEKKEA